MIKCIYKAVNNYLLIAETVLSFLSNVIIYIFIQLQYQSSAPLSIFIQKRLRLKLSFLEHHPYLTPAYIHLSMWFIFCFILHD